MILFLCVWCTRSTTSAAATAALLLQAAVCVFRLQQSFCPHGRWPACFCRVLHAKEEPKKGTETEALTLGADACMGYRKPVTSYRDCARLSKTADWIIVAILRHVPQLAAVLARDSQDIFLLWFRWRELLQELAPFFSLSGLCRQAISNTAICCLDEIQPYFQSSLYQCLGKQGGMQQLEILSLFILASSKVHTPATAIKQIQSFPAKLLLFFIFFILLPPPPLVSINV